MIAPASALPVKAPRTMIPLTMTRFLRPPVSVSRRVRAVAACVALLCAGVLAVARWLPPDGRGFGTHEALGMPPCGFQFATGLPCPTCGMTTAFSLMMHGRPIDAAAAQPAGALFCIGAMGLLALACQVAWTGRLLTPDFDRIGPVRLAMGIVLLLVAAWGYKLAHALLTRGGPGP